MSICNRPTSPTATVAEKERLRSVSFAEMREEREEQQNSSRSDVLPYQCFLFLLTQIGYIAVVPSLLVTTFFEPSSDFCENPPVSNQTEELMEKINLDGEFYSLLIQWNEHCRSSHWTFWISTSLMVGGIFGSFGAGFFADRVGRKPVVVASMIAICLGNFLIVLIANFNQFITLIIFFMIGMACGGYLVTNMVLLVEILRNSKSRLLVVSLNGWPLGMCGTALLAYVLRHWRMYHLVIAILSAIFSIIIVRSSNMEWAISFLAISISILILTTQYFAFESISWLQSAGRDGKAKTIQQRLIQINSMLSLTSKENETKNNDGLLVNFMANSQNEDKTAPIYTYLDLFRNRSISLRLITLLFCFGSSSIISFGLYFSAEVLPGSRYLNIAIMGVNKLALGFLPFLLSNCMGRRPILLSSIGLAMLAAWALVFSKLFFGLDKHFIITAFGLIMTGAIDPNWKIIHLLSIELFPTPVRNMARALCNVVARLGSLSGPWVLFLRSYNESLPFWIFAILLTVQLAISFAFLPETRGKPLPDQMPSSGNGEEDEIIHKFRPRTPTRHSIRSAHSVDFAIV